MTMRKTFRSHPLHVHQFVAFLSRGVVIVVEKPTLARKKKLLQARERLQTASFWLSFLISVTTLKGNFVSRTTMKFLWMLFSELIWIFLSLSTGWGHCYILTDVEKLPLSFDANDWLIVSSQPSLEAPLTMGITFKDTQQWTARSSKQR